MKEPTNKSPHDAVDEFYTLLSTIAEHQKRSCVLMAARGMLKEATVTRQVPRTWLYRVKRKFRQLYCDLYEQIRSKQHPVAASVEEPSAESEADLIIDGVCWVVDDKEARRSHCEP
jgi:hypothetical protein